MQGAIVYKGKYGATRDYATLLSTALNLPVSNETLTGGQLLHADYLFIGSAVYAGRLAIQKLSWIDRTALRMGAAFVKNPEQKKRMQHDFDGVHVSNINPVVQAFKTWEQDVLEKQAPYINN